MEGLFKTTYEVFEMIFVVTLSLILMVAIIFANDPYNVRAQVVSSEVSYISSLISGSNIVAEVRYEDTDLKITEDMVNTKYKTSTEIKRGYFGDTVETEKISEKNLVLRTRRQTCNQSSPPFE